jgi:hypothetical protein
MIDAPVEFPRGSPIPRGKIVDCRLKNRRECSREETIIMMSPLLNLPIYIVQFDRPGNVEGLGDCQSSPLKTGSSTIIHQQSTIQRG